MSSRYDKNVQIFREEEGSYQRREIERSPSRKSHSSQSYQIVSPSKAAPVLAAHSSDDENFEEWTVSKRKVNHKTRQVETRVSRQLLVEDGKVIADSGPQVTTRIKEDNKVEECEKEKTPKSKGKFDAILDAPEGESSGRVLGEKKEIQRVSREVREENMQYHDERFKELTGQDVHRRAIQAPHELITITDKSSQAAPRGKMVHYSNKGKKYQDTDEILEVAKLAIDGSITKEVKRTKHHEEFSEDELPDEKGEAEELRQAPKVERSSRRHVDYVNDFDDTSTPLSSSDDEREGDQRALRGHREPAEGSRAKAHSQWVKSGRTRRKEEAFPRYEIDPLLNSLKDEDFKPARSERSGAKYVEHTLERKERADSSDNEHQPQAFRHNQRSPSPFAGSNRGSAPAVDIPEEYRVNKQRLLTSKGKSTSSRQRERSFSPTSKSHLSQASQRSSKSHRSHKEDASVQAHLTDEEEEEERKSVRSSSSMSANSHEKTTRHLQRQSTANSSRNYYYGEQRRRSLSASSSSSGSSRDPKERSRKHGARSKDSGFKSPHSPRTRTPNSNGSQQQIYSVSSKSKRSRQDRGATSPTPTTASAGQRSVRTTTTTLAAGLTDRPSSRNEILPKSSASRDKRRYATGSPDSGARSPSKTREGGQKRKLNENQTRPGRGLESGRSPDNISLSSLGPLATTIKVPYRQVDSDEHDSGVERPEFEQESRGKTALEERKGEMELNKDIERLRRRLEDINRRRSDGMSSQVRKEPDRYDYKTFVADVQPAPIVPRNHTVDAYNVRVIEHKSPFTRDQGPITSVRELSNSIARLELLSGEPDTHTTRLQIPDAANNNETHFSLADIVKRRAQPAVSDSLDLEDDRISIASSCSLRSSRTYCIQDPTNQPGGAQIRGLADQKYCVSQPGQLNLDEIALDGRRPAAWVFDPRDGSTTAIVAPPRPKKPDAPKIDAKTEDLAQSRGGRSYYLELVDPRDNARKRPSSIDSLYSRSNSHSNLSVSNRPHLASLIQARSPPAPTKVEDRKSRAKEPSSLLDQSSRMARSSSTSNDNAQRNEDSQRRRQLPFCGPPLSNRSRSSSCLVSSTRPSKYSIYGGLRRPNNDKKPVPRLSYSRAIGPKSQRQLDAQSKTPSRYLKMR